MPWKGATVMDERVKFIESYETKLYTVSELCELYEISRKTAYKWIARHREEGQSGLVDRSRRPKTSPSATDPKAVRKILEAREKHPRWGPAKLLAWLGRLGGKQPKLELPGKTAAGEILKRHGLITPHQGRRRRVRWRRPLQAIERPNQVWTTDFKGQFRTGNRVYCYPLTIADGCSRYVLGCEGLLSTKHGQAWPVFERVFREFGLPDVMRSDNGLPFSSHAIGGLSRLSIRWIKLGIVCELIQPGHPEQNGRHERMHRTLKAETARPPAGNLGQQQERFDAFRAEFNEERPHEALGQKTPASVYTQSSRPYPKREPEVVYPGHFEVRKVRDDGSIRWRGNRLFVTEVLTREHVGLEEVDDGIWSLFFANVLLGRFDERDREVHRLTYDCSDDKK